MDEPGAVEQDVDRADLRESGFNRRAVEHIITLGKKGGLHNIRLAERTIRNRKLLQKLFGELKDRYANRPGGYTRIIRLGFRQGDAAEVAYLELVDRPEKAAAKSEEKAE